MMLGALQRSARRPLIGLALTLFLVGMVLVPAVQSQTLAAAREPRIALIIANSNYVSDKDRLGGPSSDAGELNRALRKQGFGGLNGASSPTVVSDRSHSQIRESILAFRESLRKAGPLSIGVLYYAGHGAADDKGNDNFMLPVDVPDVASSDPTRVGVAVTWVTDLFRISSDKERPTVIVVFDACRNTSSGQPGGPRIAMPDAQQPEGVLVALSTGVGQWASDDGKYAEVLAAKLAVPGLTIGEMFDQVKLEVAAKSGNRQIPVHQSNVVKRQCVAGCIAAGGADPLATLEVAMRNRPVGDLGQVAGIQALVAQRKVFSGLDLMGIGFAGAQIDGIEMSRAKLDGTDFDGASLIGAKLDESKLNFASLQGAKLSGAHAAGTTFQFARADGADMRKIQASRASFHAASLKKVDFRGADLRGVSFMLADLRSADFRGSDLSGAFFVGSIIEGARFDGAKIADLDMTSAIGSAAQFSAEQQMQLCATETPKFVRFELQRAIKTNAYASGIDVREAYSYGVDLLPSLHLLSRCPERKLMPSVRTIWPRGNTVESITSEMQLRYADEFLQAGARREVFEERAATALKSVEAALKSGLRVQVIGKQHLDLLAAMKINQAKANLESSPSSVYGLDFYFYMMKHGHRVADDIPWTKWAGERAEREAKMRGYPPGRYENVWPLLYPAGTNSSMLAPEHVDIFRQWTLQRARNLPDIAELPGSIALTNLRHKIGELARKDPNAPMLTVRPIEDFFAELAKQTDARDLVRTKRIGEYVVAVSTPGRHSGGATQAMVRFKTPPLGVEIQIPRIWVPAMTDADPTMDFVIKVKGASSVRVDEWTYDVLDAEIVEARLLGRDVKFSTKDGK